MFRGIRTTRATRTSRDRQSGQALLELALVAPLLILLIAAIVQFAVVFQAQIGLTNAVREAARRAAATTNPTDTWVRAQLCGADPIQCDTGLLAENVQTFADSRLTDATIEFSCYKVAGIDNFQVKVDVEYRHAIFLGVMAFATDAMDGTTDGEWTLFASAQMRLERGAPQVVPPC